MALDEEDFDMIQGHLKDILDALTDASPPRGDDSVLAALQRIEESLEELAQTQSAILQVVRKNQENE